MGGDRVVCARARLVVLCFGESDGRGREELLSEGHNRKERPLPPLGALPERPGVKGNRRACVSIARLSCPCLPKRQRETRAEPNAKCWHLLL